MTPKLQAGRIIAFSPYADFSGTAFNRRFAAISVPVMSVTGTEDVDPLGAVTSPVPPRSVREHAGGPQVFEPTLRLDGGVPGS